VELLVARCFERCQRSVLCYAPVLAPEADPLLHLLSGLEGDDRLGRHQDALAGEWITSLPSSPPVDLGDAKLRSSIRPSLTSVWVIPSKTICTASSARKCAMPHCSEIILAIAFMVMSGLSVSRNSPSISKATVPEGSGPSA
jgi:hypothetical protein